MCISLHWMKRGRREEKQGAVEVKAGQSGGKNMKQCRYSEITIVPTMAISQWSFQNKRKKISLLALSWSFGFYCEGAISALSLTKITQTSHHCVCMRDFFFLFKQTAKCWGSASVGAAGRLLCCWRCWVTLAQCLVSDLQTFPRAANLNLSRLVAKMHPKKLFQKIKNKSSFCLLIDRLASSMIRG